jgi:hypothetical protein
VAEEADAEAVLPEIHPGVAVREDVRVLVARRPVADRECRLDLDRSDGQRLEVVEVSRRQLLGGPARRREGNRVEELTRVEPAHDLVVVAPDGHLLAADAPDPVDHVVRVRAVAHEVAQDHDAVETLAPHAREHRGERLVVRMDVRKDQVPHVARAASRGPPAA